MSDQDWTTVTLSKSKEQKTSGLNQAQIIAKTRMTGGDVATQKKFSAGENKSAHQPTGNLKKLEVTFSVDIDSIFLIFS